jgi:RimJ/RimL family protein N-acetyltransferase
MFEGLSDPRGYVFLPSDPPPDLASLRTRYARLALGRSADGSEIWLNWIVRRRDDGKPMGYVQATVQGTAVLIAYHVFPRYWRRGVARAAVGAMLDLLFAGNGIERASALVDTRNAASQALLVKLGFVRVRTNPNADFFKGSSSDEFEFELLRSAWPVKTAGRGA